jgi:hypothetical protein
MSTRNGLDFTISAHLFRGITMTIIPLGESMNLEGVGKITSFIFVQVRMVSQLIYVSPNNKEKIVLFYHKDLYK